MLGLMNQIREDSSAMNVSLDLLHRPKIIGIVNITADSFSDGGLYLNPDKAITHARHLAASGDDIIELGAASSHPDACAVEPSEEIARIAPVLEVLQRERFSIERGVNVLNDIRGFPELALHRELAVRG